MSPPGRRRSYAVAAAFAAASVFHALAIVFPEISEPSPAWRHALFVAINGAYAALFARRPPWLLLACAPLALQQLFAHGTAFLEARARGHTDWQSVGVLVAIPLVAWVARGPSGYGGPPR